MARTNLFLILAFVLGVLAPWRSLTLMAGDKIAYPWLPDQSDGTYRNPIICADYSDPDVIRDGDDFYLTASSFNCTPGLPILHSRDLVNWKIVNYALKNLPIRAACSICRAMAKVCGRRRFENTMGNSGSFSPCPMRGFM